jgi:hypothetical protein
VVAPAQRQRFEEVLLGDRVCALQVGDRPRDAQRPSASAAAQLEPGAAVGEQPLERRRELDLLGRQLGIRLPASLLALARGEDPLTNGRRGLARLAGERLEGRLMDAEDDVDPVGERPGQLCLVARDRVRGAPAVAGLGTAPTWTRVRRRDQLEAARELDSMPRASDQHPARFERLAERLEGVTSELGELVEEQDAAMRERRLAGARRRAPADAAGRLDRVVGRTERAPPT